LDRNLFGWDVGCPVVGPTPVFLLRRAPAGGCCALPLPASELAVAGPLACWVL